MSYTSPNSPADIPKIFVEAWNLRDAQKIASLFDEDAEFVNVTGLWWHNRTEIEKALAYGLRVIFQYSTASIRKVQVKHLHPDIAVVHARMQLVGQSPIDNTRKPQKRQTIFSFVVHKKEGKWSCASAHNTDIAPGKETYVIDESGKMKAVDYRNK